MMLVSDCTHEKKNRYNHRTTISKNHEEASSSKTNTKHSTKMNIYKKHKHTNLVHAGIILHTRKQVQSQKLLFQKKW